MPVAGDTDDLSVPGARIVVASVDRGFVLPGCKVAVLTESDVTGRMRPHRQARTRARPVDGFFDDLAPGTAKWVDYSPQVAILVFPPPRIALAAVVRVSTTAPLPAASISLFNPFCSVIPTLEVYDTSTNKTTVVLSGPALAPPILPTPRRATSGVPALSQETQE